MRPSPARMGLRLTPVANWRTVVGGVCLALVLAGGTATAEGETRESPHSSQDLLFLGRERLVVIRVLIKVDGRPFRDVWTDSLRELFLLADRDRDGMLSSEEIQRPVPSDDPLHNELFALLTTPGLPQSDTLVPDGRLSFEEFSRFAAKQRGGPFQPDDPSEAGSARGGGAGGANGNPGQVLFSVLDKDQNNRISIAELNEGPRSIRTRDFDGDGSSSLDELDHTRNPFGQAAAVMNTPGPAPIAVLSSDHVDKDLLQRVLRTYSTPGGRGFESIGLASLGLPDAAGPRYDQDGNGTIDRRELREFLTRPFPHLELVVRVGRRADGQRAVDVREAAASDSVTVKVSDLGLVSVVLGDVQLELSVSPQLRSAETIRASIVQRFRAFDSDANGYLDRKEAERMPLQAGLFETFDRDGDGKIFETELLAVVDGRIRAALARTRMSSTDRGQDLFEILDVNRDRNLSPREILDAVGRVSLWDKDADGSLAPGEVPRIHQVVFDRGLPVLPGLTESLAVPQSGDTAAAPRTGPAWFLRMDRNNDGDVSKSEFLGTPAQFRERDRNQDGSIDTNEAVAPSDGQ